jgi:hypothetical protein
VSIALEGEQYPTLSLVLVFFYGLLQLLRLDLNLHLGNIELCVDGAHVGEEYPFNCAGVQPMDAMEDEDVERGECKFCIEADTHLPVQYKDSLLTFRADLIQAIGYRFRTLVANSAVLLAAALDPRTKELSFASATEKTAIWALLKARAVQQVLKTNELEIEQATVDQAQLQEARIQPEKKNPDTVQTTLHRLFNRAKIRVASSSSSIVPIPLQLTNEQAQRIVEDEFTRYSAAAAIDFDNSIKTNQALVWWKTHQYSFPVFSPLARIYLAIPATSAPSERIFSSASYIASKRRSSMHPETLELLVFLSKNADRL